MTGTGSARGETFDYVVVGAGASGAALAARLSEDPAISVLLLEAGGPDKKQEVHIPAAFSKLFKTPLDWDYSTEPQEHLGDRSIYWPRGKMLGGSTSINAMMWVRGYAADYDGWAQAAGPGWSYEALLPYFRRVEHVEGNTDPDQGSGGAVSIIHQRSPRSHTATFLKAVEQAGYAVESPNSARPEGFSQTMVNQKRGKRFSTADAYLKPAKGRANLTVRTDAQATKVLFEGTTAVGVEYVSGGATKQVFVKHEIVLSGGAINTPQLLLLSGVGPAADLTALGIDVVVDAPEVGANLQDHLIAALIIESDEDTLFAAEKPAQVVNFLARGRGMLTSNVGEAYGFVRTQPDLDLPDVEIIFAPVPFVAEGLVPPTGSRDHGRRDPAPAREHRPDHAHLGRPPGQAEDRAGLSHRPRRQGPGRSHGRPRRLRRPHRDTGPVGRDGVALLRARGWRRSHSRGAVGAVARQPLAHALSPHEHGADGL